MLEKNCARSISTICSAGQEHERGVRELTEHFMELNDNSIVMKFKNIVV